MTKLLSIVAVAAICHATNRAYCQEIGDNSQPKWDNAPEWQKNSAVTGVRFVLNNPEAPASANHESWLKQKEAEGWKHGEVKDAEAKTHPCFLPYDQLPKQQQAKDHLFKSIVLSLAPIIDQSELDAEAAAAGAKADGGEEKVA